MKDIINSFKAYLYERTSSPLLGAFIFYWSICNYKLIVILFDGKLTSTNKFENIDTLYKNNYYNFYDFFNIPINGLLIPLIITLIYILILPFITNLIHIAWIWHQNILKKISNGKVLTKKEFGELQRRFTELELSFDDTFSKKDNEIIKLKKLLETKDTRLLESEKVHNQLEEKIDKHKDELLKFNDLKTKNIQLENQINHQKNLIINSPKLSLEEESILKAIYDLKVTTVSNLAAQLHKKATTLRNILNKLLYDELLKIDQIGQEKNALKVSLTKLGLITIKPFIKEDIDF